MVATTTFAPWVQAMPTTAISKPSEAAFQRDSGGELMLPFDPIELRAFWLQVRLKYAIESEPPVPDDHRPPGVAHFARVSYSARRVSDFVNGYLVGLSKELKPLVEKHVSWMESEPEPDLAIYRE